MEKNIPPGTVFYSQNRVDVTTTIACLVVVRNTKGGNEFTSIKTNYLAWSKNLWDAEAIVLAYATTRNDANCPISDGTNGQIVSICNKSINFLQLTAANYKLFPFMMS